MTSDDENDLIGRMSSGNDESEFDQLLPTDAANLEAAEAEAEDEEVVGGDGDDIFAADLDDIVAGVVADLDDIVAAGAEEPLAVLANAHPDIVIGAVLRRRVQRKATAAHATAAAARAIKSGAKISRKNPRLGKAAIAAGQRALALLQRAVAKGHAKMTAGPKGGASASRITHTAPYTGKLAPHQGAVSTLLRGDEGDDAGVQSADDLATWAADLADAVDVVQSAVDQMPQSVLAQPSRLTGSATNLDGSMSDAGLTLLRWGNAASQYLVSYADSFSQQQSDLMQGFLADASAWYDRAVSLAPGLAQPQPSGSGSGAPVNIGPPPAYPSSGAGVPQPAGSGAPAPAGGAPSGGYSDEGAQQWAATQAFRRGDFDEEYEEEPQQYAADEEVAPEDEDADLDEAVRRRDEAAELAQQLDDEGEEVMGAGESDIVDDDPDPTRSPASAHRGASYLHPYGLGGSSSGEEGGEVEIEEQVVVGGEFGVDAFRARRAARRR